MIWTVVIVIVEVHTTVCVCVAFGYGGFFMPFFRENGGLL